MVTLKFIILYFVTHHALAQDNSPFFNFNKTDANDNNNRSLNTIDLISHGYDHPEVTTAKGKDSTVANITKEENSTLVNTTKVRTEHKRCHQCLKIDPSVHLKKKNYTYIPRHRREMIPQNWDWRIAGYGGIVHDQGRCGACWAFSSTGAIEYRYFMKHNKVLDLSAQQLVDCSGPRSNCQGGYPATALNNLANTTGGLMSASDYPYADDHQRCMAQQDKLVVQVTGAHILEVINEEHLKQLVYRHGPLITGMSVGDEFLEYMGGIATGRDLGCVPGAKLNHAALIMGFGETDGKMWWLIKNSYGITWGEEGYLRLSRSYSGRPQCGLTEYTVEVDVV